MSDLNTVECAYCGREVFDHNPPAPWSDTAWGEIALDHNARCEWVVTRAHRLTWWSRGANNKRDEGGQ